MPLCLGVATVWVSLAVAMPVGLQLECASPWVPCADVLTGARVRDVMVFRPNHLVRARVSVLVQATVLALVPGCATVT